MLAGKVIYVSADATEMKANAATNAASATGASDGTFNTGVATDKARVRFDGQTLKDPHGANLPLVPSMQVVAEISQGKRTVLKYLLSPVQKTVKEAGLER